jgi:hypothetical protein
MGLVPVIPSAEYYYSLMHLLFSETVGGQGGVEHDPWWQMMQWPLFS